MNWTETPPRPASYGEGMTTTLPPDPPQPPQSTVSWFGATPEPGPTLARPHWALYAAGALAFALGVVDLEGFRHLPYDVDLSLILGGLTCLGGTGGVMAYLLGRPPW